MIPRRSKGTSGKALINYLTRDKEGNLSPRVAWAHFKNLAAGDVTSAAEEMESTAEVAELLKQEAGVRAGGRATEKFVKHVSLNWAPSETPSREKMIAAAESFLRHMGWHEHQVIMVAHNDKSYHHVHLMIGTVHPETGLKLNESFEKRRMQAWALSYELEHGEIHCEERLKNAEHREKSMPRNIWMEFQKNQREFERHEQILASNSDATVTHPTNGQDVDWKILRQIQKDERLAHVANGKFEFSELRNSIYREIREEFRPRWGEYFERKAGGADAAFLAEMKDQLVAEQKAVLETRRDVACSELRESRDLRYQGLLDRQQEQRDELRWHHEVGLDTADFFHGVAVDPTTSAEISAEFAETSHGVTSRGRDAEPRADKAPVLGGGDVYPEIPGVAAIGGRALALVDALFSALMNLGAVPPDPPTREEKQEAFRIAAEEAITQRYLGTVKKEEAEREDRQKALYRE